jgi:hypothetical protein
VLQEIAAGSSGKRRAGARRRGGSDRAAGIDVERRHT